MSGPETVTVVRCPWCGSLEGSTAKAFQHHAQEVHGKSERIYFEGFTGKKKGWWIGSTPLMFVQVPLCPECGRPSPGDQKVREGGKCALCSIALEIGKVGPELGS